MNGWMSLPDKVVANIHGRAMGRDLESDRKLDAWRLRQGNQGAKVVRVAENYIGRQEPDEGLRWMKLSQAELEMYAVHFVLL